MSINVKAKVDFNSIIQKLHKVAKDFAEQKSGKKIELDNLAFDDQKGEFLGGGEFCIFMKQTEGNVTEKDKPSFLEVIKEYVHYFVGEDAVEYVKEDNLQPLYEGSTGDPEKEQREQEQQLSSVQQESESQSLGTDENILKLLFETRKKDYYKNNVNKKNGEESEKETTGPTETDNNGEQREDDETEQQSKLNCIGYGVSYSIDVNGKTDWTIAKAIKNKSKGLFGGLISDLKNITIEVGGKKVHVGHVFDLEKWKEKVGMKDIDKDTVVESVKKAFENDFKHNKAEITVEQSQYLEEVLKQKGKASPEILKSMSDGQEGNTIVGYALGKIAKIFQGCKYSILIQVGNKDPWYSKYNRKTIAETASKAFGTTYNAGVDWNSVKENDVIKIDNTDKIKPQKKDDDKSIMSKLRELVNKEDNKEKKEKDSEKKKTKQNESFEIYGCSLLKLLFEEQETEKPSTPQSTGIENNDEERTDWYIIPHRGIKDKGDRHMQSQTDGNGVTITKTSDKDYSPTDKII